VLDDFAVSTQLKGSLTQLFGGDCGIELLDWWHESAEFLRK
jgi:hypothetical protein